MAVTHDEFYRLINKTIDNASEVTVKLSTSTINFPFSKGEIIICLGEQQIRKIASLSIEHMLIKFEFRNLTKGEIESYMQKFDITFQKGGG